MKRKHFRFFFWLIFISYLGLAFRSDNSIADLPLSEDGYYSLTIARNIAEGNGISYNGINPTNGFQPLFTFLTVPLFWISGEDNYLVLRLFLVLSAIVFLLSSLLFGRNFAETFKFNDEKNSSIREIASYAFISSLFLFSLYFNGLESGFLLLMINVFWHFSIKFDFSKAKDVFLLGIIAGILVLTRIDMAIFVLVFSFVLLILSSQSKLRNFLIFSFTALVVSSPWFLYNYFYFGSVMPSSGTAQQQIWFFADWRTLPLLTSIAINLLPHTYTFERILFGLNELAVKSGILIIVFFIIRNSCKKQYFKFDFKNNAFLLSILISSVLLAFWYYSTSWAVFFYPRYLSLLSIAGVTIFALVLVSLNSDKKWLSIALISLILLMNLGLVFALIFRFGFSGSTFYSEQLVLVQRNVPGNDIVSAAQTGTLGFFRKNVVNLDGKVNAEAIPFRHKGLEYLKKRGINWFCDWRMGVDRYLGPNPEKSGWRLIDSTKHFQLYNKAK